MAKYITDELKQTIKKLLTETTQILEKINSELKQIKHEQIMEPTVQGYIEYTEQIVAVDSVKCILKNGLNDNQQFLKDLEHFYDYLI